MTKGKIYRYKNVSDLYFIGQYKSNQTLLGFNGGRYIELGDDLSRVLNKFDDLHLNIQDIELNNIALSLLENSNTINDVNDISFRDGTLVKSEIDDEVFMCFYSLETKIVAMFNLNELEHYLVSLKTGSITQVKNQEFVFKNFIVYDATIRELEINIKGI